MRDAKRARFRSLLTLRAAAIVAAPRGKKAAATYHAGGKKLSRFLSASDSCGLRRGREGRRPAETGPSGYALEGPSC